MADESVVLHVELNVINGRNLQFREDSFLRTLLFLLHFDQHIWSIAACLTDVSNLLDLPHWLSLDSLFPRADLFEADVEVLLDERVKPILDFVLRSTGQVLADLWPLAANFAVQFQDLMVFFLAPVFLLYSWIQLVDEPFPDLLAVFRAQHLRKELPVFSVLFDKFLDGLILIRRPYLMVLAQLWQSPIPVQALILVSVVH